MYCGITGTTMVGCNSIRSMHQVHLGLTMVWCSMLLRISPSTAPHRQPIQWNFRCLKATCRHSFQSSIWLHLLDQLLSLNVDGSQSLPDECGLYIDVVEISIPNQWDNASYCWEMTSMIHQASSEKYDTSFSRLMSSPLRWCCSFASWRHMSIR